ncbi:MAG TPA: efflux RND transporter permease subunit, partial [Myxococcaceae bacterium]|nr:efflux RND transporter permease subunit [Myxococcaceae bacterium]
MVAELRPTLPPGISLSPWLDSSEVSEDRLKLLLKNAALGLGLVLLVLGAFLEPRLAFWVMLGIPLSFLGAMLLLPLLDVSINMVSLFAFIIVLGMVVDDAIVVGEAIYHRRQHGEPRLQAAIAGVREVSMPVVFAIVTTVLAFAPMLFVPGVGGKIFRNIPLIVIPVLLFSLVEALLILPAHLAHSKPTAPRGVLGWVVRRQEKVARGLEWFTSHVYARHLRAASRRRYLTLAVFVSILVATLGLVAGGRVGFVFMPRVESDMVSVRVELPFGAPVEDTRAAKERVEHAAREALAALGGEHYARGQFSQLGAATLSPGGGPDSGAGAHVAEVAVHLVPADARPFGAEAFSRQWREEIGELPGVERLSFDFATASSGEAPIAFDLRHPDPEQLEAAGARLAQRLSTYTGVFDVDDGFTEGKEQLDLTLTAEGRSLGLTAADVARQVRSAFFGAEALRQQRGRDEVRVYVRLPRSQQRSEQDVEDFLLRTPQGGVVPLRVAADVERGRSYAEILRRDGFRIAPVTADVDPAVTNANEVVARVIQQDLPALQEEFPGLTWRLGGEQREQREALGSLGRLFLLAMLAIYALLATALRSYVQPLIILSAVPFGVVGAVRGHVL